MHPRHLSRRTMPRQTHHNDLNCCRRCTCRTRQLLGMVIPSVAQLNIHNGLMRSLGHSTKSNHLTAILLALLMHMVREQARPPFAQSPCGRLGCQLRVYTSVPPRAKAIRASPTCILTACRSTRFCKDSWSMSGSVE